MVIARRIFDSHSWVETSRQAERNTSLGEFVSSFVCETIRHCKEKESEGRLSVSGCRRKLHLIKVAAVSKITMSTVQ